MVPKKEQPLLPLSIQEQMLQMAKARETVVK